MERTSDAREFASSQTNQTTRQTLNLSQEERPADGNVSLTFTLGETPGVKGEMLVLRGDSGIKKDMDSDNSELA